MTTTTLNTIQWTTYGTVPSKKNGRRWIRRGKGKYSVPSLRYTNWERESIAWLQSRIKERDLTQYQLELRIFFANDRVRDTDNLLTSIQDCLKAAGIIKDDRWQYMISPPIVHQPIIDKLNPRVEVTITYG